MSNGDAVVLTGGRYHNSPATLYTVWSHFKVSHEEAGKVGWTAESPKRDKEIAVEQDRRVDIGAALTGTATEI